MFVLFARLSELPPPVSPLEPRSNIDKEEEKRRDTELAAEIALRKRSTVERNIKLTVVLIASRRLLGTEVSHVASRCMMTSFTVR